MPLHPPNPACHAGAHRKACSEAEAAGREQAKLEESTSNTVIPFSVFQHGFQHGLGLSSEHSSTAGLSGLSRDATVGVTEFSVNDAGI